MRPGRGSATVCRCSHTHRQGASEPRAGHEGLKDAINTAAGPVREDNEQGATIRRRLNSTHKEALSLVQLCGEEQYRNPGGLLMLVWLAIGCSRRSGCFARCCHIALC